MTVSGMTPSSLWHLMTRKFMADPEDGRGGQKPLPAVPSHLEEWSCPGPLRCHRGKAQSNGQATLQCMICMEDFEDGQELRTLPCLHIYHVQCIDRSAPELHTPPPAPTSFHRSLLPPVLPVVVRSHPFAQPFACQCATVVTTPLYYGHTAALFKRANAPAARCLPSGCNPCTSSIHKTGHLCVVV